MKPLWKGWAVVIANPHGEWSDPAYTGATRSVVIRRHDEAWSNPSYGFKNMRKAGRARCVRVMLVEVEK